MIAEDLVVFLVLRSEEDELFDALQNIGVPQQNIKYKLIFKCIKNSRCVQFYCTAVHKYYDFQINI
jgi:hypothetical protein